MARSSISIPVYARTTLAVPFVRLMALVGPLIGPERALRWAHSIAPRLVLIRIGERGRWRLLGRRAEDDPQRVNGGNER